MLADALGRPLRFIVTAGRVGDLTQAPALLEGRAGGAVMADKGYDSNALRGLVAAMRMEAIIPSSRARKVVIPHDAEAYRQCNCMTHFRRFATRYDRRTVHFTGFAHLAACMIWIT